MYETTQLGYIDSSDLVFIPYDIKSTTGTKSVVSAHCIFVYDTNDYSDARKLCILFLCNVWKLRRSNSRYGIYIIFYPISRCLVYYACIQTGNEIIAE